MFDLGAFLSGDYVPLGADVITISPDVQTSSSSWSDSSSQQWHDSSFNTNTVKSSSTQYKAPPPPVVPQAPTIAQASNVGRQATVAGAARPSAASAGGGYGNYGNSGRILSDAEFNDQLRGFMPQWNTANAQSRMQQLAANGQQGGWEYQMLADSLRPGWNVPQGQVAMSAGNQHVNQLMQYADMGVMPNADMLATARHYDDLWNQGGPATKLPMITAGGQDWSSGYEAATPTPKTEVYGPQQPQYRNWGESGGADPSLWAHNYQGESTGSYGETSGRQATINGLAPVSPAFGRAINDGLGDVYHGLYPPQGPQMIIPQQSNIPSVPAYDPYNPYSGGIGPMPGVSGNPMATPNGLNYGHQQDGPYFEMSRPSPFSPEGQTDSNLYAMQPANYSQSPVIDVSGGLRNAQTFMNDMGKIWAPVGDSWSLQNLDANTAGPSYTDPSTQAMINGWQNLPARTVTALQAEMRRRYGFSNNNLSR
jgi:hypothetical protein